MTANIEIKLYAHVQATSLATTIEALDVACAADAVRKCMAMNNPYHSAFMFRLYTQQSTVIDGVTFRADPVAVSGRCFIAWNDASVKTKAELIDAARAALRDHAAQAALRDSFNRDNLQQQLDMAHNRDDGSYFIMAQTGHALLLYAQDRVFDRTGRQLWPCEIPVKRLQLRR